MLRRALPGLVSLYGCSLARAQTPPVTGSEAPPAVVAFEGDPEGRETQVTVRAGPGLAGRTVLGRVTHVDGAALRGLVLAGRDSARPTVLVTAATHRTVRASAYTASLFRVDATGASTTLCDQVAELSTPLQTANGTVLVQRGRDGDEPVDDGTRQFREREDQLEIAAIAPSTGRLRTVWQGRGQLAFLAAALQGDEVAVYWVHNGASTLMALDARTGAQRVLCQNLPVARDFSYDPVHRRVVFARATQDPQQYEVAAVSALGGPVTVLARGASDRLMPAALGDGAVAFSRPDAQGLGLVAASANVGPPTRAGAAPEGAVSWVTPFALQGPGTDAVVAQHSSGRWIVRHTDSARQEWSLWSRATRQVIVPSSPEAAIELVGFVPEGAAR